MRIFSWEFDSSKISAKDTFSVRYNLDERGYILNSVDFKDGTHTNFSYNSDNQLTRKGVVDSNNNNLVEEWIYDYKDNRLSRVQQSVRGKILMEYFFSKEGLIDSALYEGKGIVKYQYKYN